MTSAVARRTLPGTVNRVWSLWTTREGLEAWYFPAYLRPKVEELDLRPGGALRIAAPGLAFELAGTFTEVTPPTRLTTRAEYRFNKHLPDHVREDRLTLTPSGLGCEVELTSSPLPDERTRSAVEGAYGILLNRLEHALGSPLAAREAEPPLAQDR